MLIGFDQVLPKFRETDIWMALGSSVASPPHPPLVWGLRGSVSHTRYALSAGSIASAGQCANMVVSATFTGLLNDAWPRFQVATPRPRVLSPALNTTGSISLLSWWS